MTLNCPRCYRAMFWSNDYDLGEDEHEETYTDYTCSCGVMVTVPWDMQNDEDEDDLDDK